MRAQRWMLAWVIAGALASGAIAAPPNLAPGFSGLPPGARILLPPFDVELFELTAGGVVEPKADWTAAALGHMKAALKRRADSLGLGPDALIELSERDADAYGEVLALHGAVARSINLHHLGPSTLHLPTKAGLLDWSFGDVLQPLQQATGARYALFVWVRDSYATAERKAMMVGMALLGVGMGGGAQVGYASLVDMQTGQVLWFSRLLRGSGDLRDAAPAVESVNALLRGFPSRK
jgi:hypothetical protein